MRIAFLVTVLAACSGPVQNAGPETGPTSAPAKQGESAHHEGHDGAHEGKQARVVGEWEEYGGTFAEGDVVTLGAVLDAPDAHMAGPVRVSGTVSEVCQKAGCWMVLSEGERHVRVRMKDHDFSVDKAGAGRESQVYGTLVAKNVDPEEVAHFASETRDGGVVPEQGMSGKLYELEASSVRMRATH